MKKTIYELLKENAQSDIYPFHMPGHKRNGEIDFLPADVDITEIDGFDNLHHATGILKEAREKAASFYGAKRTWYLVNGSTSGLLISISAIAHNLGGTLVMARNCHKAAYNAAYLNRLNIEYVYPVNGCIEASDVGAAIDGGDNVTGVVITSPTYDGFVSDIRAIAAVCHERNVPLIVDEAHGAHFVLGKMFPESALNLGADVVIHSLHKTLPSMTQTALLHLQGDMVSENDIDMYSGIYQSSSPSYVMMAGMESCIEYLIENRDRLCDSYVNNLADFRRKVSRLKYLQVCVCKVDINVFDKDVSKILIYCKNVRRRDSDEICDGQWLYDVLLNKYHLQMEMAAADYVIALTSVMDSHEGFVRLAAALADIDNKLEFVRCDDNELKPDTSDEISDFVGELQKPEIVCSIFEALSSDCREVLFEESAGYVSAEYVYLYPPGCPLIVPGERITLELTESIMKYQSRNYNVEGARDLELKKILVLK